MNEPLAARSNAKTVWQQDDDYYKPSVVIHGDDGIGIQVGGHVVIKTAMQWQDLANQLASEKQQHQIMDAAYWAAKEQLDDQTAALGALAEALKNLPERICHLAWCAYQMGAGLPMNEEPTDAQLASLRDGLDAWVHNPEMTAEQNHENWMRFKQEQGWVYGSIKDEREKTHPDLVPYPELSELERLKDEMDIMARHVAYRIIQALAPDAVQQALEAWKAKDAALGALAAGVAVLSEFDPAEIRPKELEHTIQRILASDAVQQATEEQRRARLPLFQLGDFTLHSGQKSRWKIECDALTDADWETLAAMIAEHQKFGSVIGVPAGGLKLAAALKRHVSLSGQILVVDDVLTTGASIHDMMLEYPGSVGWVVFARGDCPPRVQALFQMAAAQYRAALTVVERVKDDVLLGSLLLAVADPRSGVSDSHKVSVQYVQAMLLGDTAQDTSTGGVADVEALERRTQEKP